MPGCSHKVWEGFHGHPCRRNAWKDGYCKQHHPDTVKARREESEKAYEEKQKKSPWYLLQKANERIAYLKKENEMLRVKLGQIPDTDTDADTGA